VRDDLISLLAWPLVQAAEQYLGYLDADLGAMSKDVASATEEAHLFELRARLREAGPDIPEHFERLLVLAISQMLDHPLTEFAVPQVTGAPKLTLKSLSILDDDDYQLQLAASSSAKASIENATVIDELNLIGARLEAHPVMRNHHAQFGERFVLNVKVLAIGPQAQMRLLMEALQKLELSTKDLVYCLETLSKHVLRELKSAYREINEELAALGLAPDLELGFVRKALVTQAHTQAQTQAQPSVANATLTRVDGSASQTQSNPPSTGQTPTAIEPIANVFSNLAQRWRASNGSTAAIALADYCAPPVYSTSGSSSLNSPQRTAPNVDARAAAPFAPDVLYDALARLFSGTSLIAASTKEQSWNNLLSEARVMSVQRNSVLRHAASTNLQTNSQTGSNAALPDFNLWTFAEQLSPQTRAAIDVETRLAVDILALLFDYIFDDRCLIPQVKDKLCELQMPVLNLAVRDQAFFSQREHPARRLLDRLAAAGMTCGFEEDLQDNSLYAAISHTVAQFIQLTNDQADAHAAGAALGAEYMREQCARLLQLFEDSLTQFEHDDRAFVEQSVAVAQARAQREQVRKSAEEALNAPLYDNELPAIVRDVIEQTWPKVLTRAYADGGQEGNAWRESLQTVVDLVWSLQPKSLAEDRNRLVSILPNLLDRVQRGFDRVALDQPLRDQFFSVLVDCHAFAMRYDRVLADANAADGVDAGSGASASAGNKLVSPMSHYSGPGTLFSPHAPNQSVDAPSQFPTKLNSPAGLKLPSDEYPAGNRPSGQRPSSMTLEQYSAWLSHEDTKSLQSTASVPSLRQERVVEQGVRLSEWRLAHGARLSAAPHHLGRSNVIAFPKPAIEIGQWAELMDGQDTIATQSASVLVDTHTADRQDWSNALRLKLSWKSPDNELLLFTNPYLGEALSIDQQSFAAQLATGLARILEQAPLSERALNGVMRTLDGSVIH
jgi:hypothetical protein